MRRREFIRNSLWVAGSVALSNVAFGAKKKSIGLQLYTLRDVIHQDPKGILKKVADFGYTDVETYAYKDGTIFGLDFKEFGAYVKSLGVAVRSGHYPLAMARDTEKWKQAVADAKAVGQQFMVVPYIDKPERETVAAYKDICNVLNKAGAVCNDSGIRFLYHNHAFEFETLEGQIPYDLMLQALDPKLVAMEMDLYWVANAGRDPLEYFNKYPGRFELWHVKDMDKADKSKQTEFGNGQIDFKRIFAKSKKAGLKAFFIEQENYTVGSIESTKACIDNFRRMM